MRRARVIPTLLIYRNGLYKTERFRQPKYVGDPINAVKIFNEKEVDELIILDIRASKEKRTPDFLAIEQIVSEAFMPVAYGGGIQTINQIERLLYLGVEKIVLNSAAFHKPELLTYAAKNIGSQSVMVSIDYKRNFVGNCKVYLSDGTGNTGKDVVEYARELEELGVGEIMLTAIDREGSYTGYDLQLLEKLCRAVSIPVIAQGGAGNLKHFLEAVQSGASAVAAGSMFVFQQPHKAVLITYPTQHELEKEIFSKI